MFFTEINKTIRITVEFFIHYCDIIISQWFYVQYCADGILSKYTWKIVGINFNLRRACAFVQLQKILLLQSVKSLFRHKTEFTFQLFQMPILWIL